MIIFDAHVHFYACYDLKMVIKTAFLRLSSGFLAKNDKKAQIKAIFLAERTDCDFFSRLKDKSGLFGEKIDVFPVDGDPSVRVMDDAGEELYIVAGRQIATRERLEVMAVGTESRFPDGVPVNETVESVRAVGGLPVLVWAPGKWLGARGKLVRGLIETGAPGALAVCDTTLRPTLWLEPILMRRARERGMAVLAGSDPLPFPGEEARMGQYGTVLDAELDPARPGASLRDALKNPSAVMRVFGRRGGLMEVGARLMKLRRCHPCRAECP